MAGGFVLHQFLELSLFLLSAVFVFFFVFHIFKFWQKHKNLKFSFVVEKIGLRKVLLFYFIFGFMFAFFCVEFVEYLNLYKFFPGYSYRTISRLIFFPIFILLYYFRDNFTFMFFRKIFKKFGKVRGWILILLLFFFGVSVLFLIGFLIN